MPHYKDWYGTRFQDPDDAGESWGTFDPEVDLTQAATSVNWKETDSNSVSETVANNLTAAYWDNNNLPRPEAFAVLIQPEYCEHSTCFQVWDVTWEQQTGTLSQQAPLVMSFEEIVDSAKTGQSSAFSSIGSVYFQVDSVPIPEPSSGMLLGLAMAWGLIALLTRRFWRCCTGAAQGVKSVWMCCFM